MLRVLFIHVNKDIATEYKVHGLLAQYADPQEVGCYFIWQSSAQNTQQNEPDRPPVHHIFWDFGRNFSRTPRPSRWKRAWMMLWRLPWSLIFLIIQLIKIRPHLIYTCQQTYDIRLVNLVRLVFPIPHLIHVHYPYDDLTDKAVRRTIYKSKRLLAVSEFIQRGLLAAGIAPERVQSLLNPADLDKFHLPKDRARLRQEFNWSLANPVVVSAGRLDPSKGHLVLLEAWARVQRQIPQARLLICGETTTRNGYDKVLYNKVAELGLNDSVVFAGLRSDLPYIFAGADVFCLLSENDACPLVFLEAAAASLPVVAYHSGGVPELVADGETGFLCRVGDVEAVACALLELLQNPARAVKIGQNGLNLVSSNFAPRQVSAKWAELLYQAAGIPRTSRTVAPETVSEEQPARVSD